MGINIIKNHGILTLPLSLFWLTFCLSVQAKPIPTQLYSVQLQQGITAFAGHPRLLSATTTNNRIRSWNAVYYFTIELPPDASEPLKTIEITQTQGVNVPRYDRYKTRVFTGDRHNRGSFFTIQETLIKNRTITLILDDPIPPGTTFTVGLSPVRNPHITGVYLFGVAAFPEGETPQRAFLGFGRLHFYHPYF